MGTDPLRLLVPSEILVSAVRLTSSEGMVPANPHSFNTLHSHLSAHLHVALTFASHSRWRRAYDSAPSAVPQKLFSHPVSCGQPVLLVEA